MTLTLTPAARARFTAWLQDVGSAELRADAVESEMLQIMEDRAESGESMSYELGRQYTTTGQPELFYADAKDFDDDQAHIISAVLGDDAEVIELSFDPVRPESQVMYRYPEVSDEWQSCPFQSADLRHLSDEAACAKVNNWVG